MNKQELASKIWASANKMRSRIEANEYKDYILGFIFYKFLSDKEVAFLVNDCGWAPGELPQLVEETEPDTVEECRAKLGYFIAYKDLFSTWIDPNQHFSVGDVRDALARFARLISPLHEKVYRGIFDTLQNGLSKLGDTAGAQTKAIANLLDLIKDIPTDGAQDYDVLGFIYEYLIGNFAANAGKKAGEFYTPHEVSLMMSQIVAHHLRHREGRVSIYDPTSGSGSLLLNIGRSVGRYFKDRDGITYYAQELKEPTFNLTRMNLVMRGILPDNIVVRNADTLKDDWPMIDENGQYFALYCDAVVSNPPYSQEWDPADDSASDPRYSAFGVAPRGTADYAFLLHDLYHVKPDGIMTIVLPHGVLFRGGAEQEIRRKLVERNHIDAIIGLPPNIFFGTGIPTLVMVLKQKRQADDILIVDASRGFAKEGTNNKLRARDIRKIVDAVTERRDIPGFARAVPRQQVRDNDYNLNIPRYVSAAQADAPWDLHATTLGGVPNSEIAALAPFWTAFPSLKAQLFEPLSGAYSRCRHHDDDALRAAIADNAEVAAYMERYRQAVASLDSSWTYVLVSGPRAPHEQHDFEAIAQHLRRAMEPFSVMDHYAAYQILADAWGVIAPDLEMLRTEGPGALRAVEPNMVVRRRGRADVEVQDGWKGRVLPLDLVARELATGHNEVTARLAALTDDEAKRLLHAKWIEPLTAALLALAHEQITDRLAAAVAALRDKYANTLADIDREVTRSQNALAALMGDLRGSKYDMDAIAALQAILSRHE